MSADTTPVILVTKGQHGGPNEYRCIVAQEVKNLFDDTRSTEFDIDPEMVKSYFGEAAPVSSMTDAEIRLRDVIRWFNEANVSIQYPQLTLDYSDQATYRELVAGYLL